VGNSEYNFHGWKNSHSISPIYHGTKFAVEGLSECIRYELGLFNIKIILIEPGVVGSNFWNNINMANYSENRVDEVGDKIKAGIKAMTKKIKDPDKDLQAEYIKEKFKEDTKDY
jgi:short-subunit dehydrogenase